MYFWKRCRGGLILLTLVENFVCNKANFKLYSVSDWQPMSFFSCGVIWENLEERVTTLQSECWTSCNLLNSKSVSDKKSELQYSNLLLTKAFANSTNVLRSRRGQIL